MQNEEEVISRQLFRYQLQERASGASVPQGDR